MLAAMLLPECCSFRRPPLVLPVGRTVDKEDARQPSDTRGSNNEPR